VSTTNQSMFEALFDRRLKPTGTFAERLKQAGYDAEKAEPKYPTEVWKRCLEVAREEVWPQLPMEQAYRAIGVEFTRGFLDTLVGKLITVALPFMSPLGFLQKLQSYFRMGRNDTGLVFEIVESGDGFARCHVHNPAMVHGEFVAGIVQVAMEKLSVDYTVEVQHQSPTDYDLTVRWQKR